MAINRFRYLFALLVAGAAALPASALAQSAVLRGPGGAHIGYTDDRLVSYGDARRVAYDHGYRAGLREGERDARRGDRFEYEDEREFRKGDRGYHRSYGDRDRYRQIFRSGYAAGYGDAYHRIGSYERYGRDDRYRNPRYGRSGDPRYGGYGGYGDPRNGRYGGGYGYSPAFENGARDGYEKGQEDARKNRSFDPLRHSWYRSGDRHYEGRYGPREQYKDVYRRGFQEGYERGFQERRYRW